MDNVIENSDAQKFSCLSESIGNLDVLSTWLWVARWMVVREQYRSRALDYRGLEDFARMHERRIKRSNRDPDDALHPMFCVETCNDELLLVIGWMLIPKTLEKSLSFVRVCDARTVLEGALIDKRHSLHRTVMVVQRGYRETRISE